VKKLLCIISCEKAESHFIEITINYGFKICYTTEKQGKKWFACVTRDIADKYHDIFTRESENSAIKQLSHLHYKNLQILEIAAPHFFIF
jgi:hypothetical protein